MKTQINFYYKVDGIEKIADTYKEWLLEVAQHYDHSISELNYTFMSDEDLLQINIDHLGHDFYTDIITFDNTIGNVISADIAISYDRLLDNINTFNQSYQAELKRTMVHGVLHCLGFNDSTPEEKHHMRSLENEMINMFHVKHIKPSLDVQ